MMDRAERARLRALCEAIPAGDVTPCCGRAGEDGHHSSWSLGATPHGAAIRAWVAGPLDLLALVRDALPALIEDSERLAKAERERDEARAEVERLREQVRVWRTLAHDGSIASRDLGAIGATEAALALASCARRAGQHAAQGAEAERETCAAICDAAGDAAEVERDACCDDRSRSLHAGRMHGADECARAIRARGAGGAT